MSTYCLDRVVIKLDACSSRYAGLVLHDISQRNRRRTPVYVIVGLTFLASLHSSCTFLLLTMLLPNLLCCWNAQRIEGLMRVYDLAEILLRRGDLTLFSVTLAWMLEENNEGTLHCRRAFWIC